MPASFGVSGEQDFKEIQYRLVKCFRKEEQDKSKIFAMSGRMGLDREP
jgi:hypothetical protein